MRAREFMTSPVIAVTPDVPIHEAAALLSSHGFTALAVVDGQRLVGVVTDADLLRGEHTDHRPGETPVRAVMSTPVLGVDPDAPIGAVARIMVEDHVRWVPVVAGAALVGVVTRRDLVRVMAHTGT
ncbi:CBS domain-containing protein [Saccharothrix variisporea]|uniref:CBS domain protein n=1 Tax=Saccharothrix variisporea TaxID=543527 RepID=A0A495X5K7_9PSEU|nr:CBS domain-containing protein [Saccharothrix variisporea]RKT69252.1 CBS domain protein [Saccharothrix variisporea]